MSYQYCSIIELVKHRCQHEIDQLQQDYELRFTGVLDTSIVNGKKVSTEVYNKYRNFLEKHKKYLYQAAKSYIDIFFQTLKEINKLELTLESNVNQEAVTQIESQMDDVKSKIQALKSRQNELTV